MRLERNKRQKLAQKLSFSEEKEIVERVTVIHKRGKEEKCVHLPNNKIRAQAVSRRRPRRRLWPVRIQCNDSDGNGDDDEDGDGRLETNPSAERERKRSPFRNDHPRVLSCLGVLDLL